MVRDEVMCQLCAALVLHFGSWREVSATTWVSQSSVCQSWESHAAQRGPVTQRPSASGLFAPSGLIARGCGGVSRLLSRLALFQPLDVVAELESRSQLQTHVLHDHVAPQQHQSFPVDLLQVRERKVGVNGPFGGKTETRVYVQSLFWS